MSLLFINEYLNFRNYQISSRMFVDNDRGEDKLKVNIDIDFYKFPCELLAIDTVNNLGAHLQTIDGKLTKTYLDKNGKTLSTQPYSLQSLGTYGHNHEHYAQPDYEKLKKEINNEEGCKIQGFFYVDAVPGSFYISSELFGATVERLKKDNLIKYNMNHKINELSFGENKDYRKILFSFGYKLYTLTHTINKMEKKKNKEQKNFLYYLKIVPTKFISFTKTNVNGFHYTYNSNIDNTSNNIPFVYFKYDLSPITVEYKHSKMTFLTFFINICAILGGVFTVAGIIDAIVHKSVLILLRKAEMNKLA